MKRALLFFSFVVIFSGSCSDDPPAPDPVTPQEPDTEFSAVINNTSWETFAPIGHEEISADHYLGNYFHILGRNYTGTGISHVYIRVNNLNDTGLFVLDDYNWAEYYDSPNNKRYRTDAAYTGVLRVTDFNYADGEITGVFQFTGRDTATADTAVVASGKIINVSFNKY